MPNTARRDGIYDFRRGVPLSRLLGLCRRELSYSLKTGSPGLSATRSRTLHVRSEALFSLGVWDRSRALWTGPADYAPCQRFAAAARSIDAQLIRYESVRDVAHGANIALLDPTAFQRPVPSPERSWHFRFRDHRLTAFAAGDTRERSDFTFAQFGLIAP